MYWRYLDGIIEVITGPMFSGKSEELIKRIKILHYADIKTLIVKPFFDKRFNQEKIVSRNGTNIKAIIVKNPKEIYDYLDKSHKAIAIDEAQFFEQNLIDVVIDLAHQGHRVLISGLDTDFAQKPFTIMPHLLAIADNVHKLKAVCFVCKRTASFTYRITLNQEQKILGDFDSYEARCRSCHFKGEKSKKN